MKSKDQWPKAIFYDSKNTLFDWNRIWIKASSQIIEKYNDTITGKQFWKIWAHFLIGENLRVAFGRYREFTDCLRDSLVYAFRYYGISGDPEDVQTMVGLWDEVQPFPDVLPALTKQKEFTKILIYSNVETAYLEMMVNKLRDFRPDFIGDMQKSRSCKPSPRAYHWVLENMHLKIDDVLYCAGVQWDMQGAIACGMKTAWLKRAHIKDPLEGIEPHYTVQDLPELTEIAESHLRPHQ